MPISFRLVSGGRGVVYEASGVLTGREVIAANKQNFARDLVANPMLFGFFDCNSITGVNISTDELREMAAQDIAAAQRMGNRAIVAVYAKNDLPYALARMWMVFVEASGWETNAFRDKSAALAWLQARVAANFGIELDLNPVLAEMK